MRCLDPLLQVLKCKNSHTKDVEHNLKYKQSFTGPPNGGAQCSGTFRQHLTGPGQRQGGDAYLPTWCVKVKDMLIFLFDVSYW